MTCLLLKIIIDVIPVNIYNYISIYIAIFIYVMLQKLIIFKYMR